MKVELDLFTSVTGWSGAGVDFSLNDHNKYIAEYQTKSLIIHVPAGSKGVAITKVLTPVDISSCREIVLSLWSRCLPQVKMITPSDFNYTIQFDDTHIFMLPTSREFTTESFGIDGTWDVVDQITITPTTDKEDWLVLSCCYGVWDDTALDVMQGVVLGLEAAVKVVSPNGLAIGTISCAAGAVSLHPSAQTWLEKGVSVYIEDGVNSETHQIERYDGVSIWFTSLMDGKTIKHAHSIRPMFLKIPVNYGVMEKEATIPAITVWGMGSKNNQDRQDLEQIIDSLSPEGAGAVRRTTWSQKIPILIDCEARQHQLLALVASCARMFLSSNRVWINGRAHDLDYPDQGVYVEPKDSTVMIPKIQYALDVEVREEREYRTWMPAVTGQTLTYSIHRGTLDTGTP